MQSLIKIKSFFSPLRTSIGINVFYLVIFAIFGVARYGALDDYFMAAVLNGAYGSEFDPHLVFVNATIAYLLYPLMIIFPKVGWFYIFEMGSILASFTIFSFFLIRQTGLKIGIPFAFLLSSLSLDFYAQVSFTQCAALLVGAGGLLFICGAREKNIAFLYSSIVFLVLGAALRWQMFLLSLPFLLLTLLLQSCWRNFVNVKVIVALLLCIASFGAIRAFDERFYIAPDYQYYKSYQGGRALFGDGAWYDKESVYDELEEIGLQGRDFLLLKDWTFYDTEVFCIDSLNNISRVVERNIYPVNKKRMPVAIGLALSNAFMRNDALCWCLLCVYLLVFSERRSRLYPWLSLLAITLGYVYLFRANRLVVHVEMGMWLYAIVLAIPFVRKTERSQIPPVAALLAIGFIIAGLLSLPQTTSTRHFVSIPEMSESWQRFLHYAEKHPEDVFLLSFEQYKDLGMVKDPAYRAPAPGSWRNIFPLGYWNIHLPAMRKELESRGIQNPLRDIVNDNVYLLETGNLPHYQHYYQVHYHKSLSVDTVESFGDVMLLKYKEIQQ